ncbi:MAG: Gfo/Idh/MocA family oxidoreductase [Verrucomicrobia bacterium]|nr:Gfo/Idh/MocA family oxidoreductase [Verrucomicrobiota bacterium]
MHTPNLTRRAFLHSTGLAAGAALLARPRLTAATATPANRRLQLALIGVGGRGKAALSALQNEQIVAFCDVDFARGREELAASPNFRKMLARFPDAKWFNDYRVMFEQMADQIDAVVVSVPDHMHYAIGMAAVRLRKHLYVEKPLCRCITEVRALRAAAAQAGVVTQMGNQGRAAEGIRLAREWVQAGLLGRVHTVHAWNNTPSKSYSLDLTPGPAETPPATLHYDLWLGVAPERPYRKVCSHGVWRGFTDYGTGRLGDWACHQMDAANFALDLGAPTSVEAATTEPKPGTFPATTALTYQFPARGDRGPVTLRWFDGGLVPPQPVEGFAFRPEGGSIFYGDKGAMWVASHSNTARLLPESRMKELAASLPPKTIPRVSGGPHVEWVNAIRAGTRCGSDFDYAAPLAELALLGVAAIRAQGRLEWDATTARIANFPSAQKFIGPGYEYRPGWGV